MRRTSLGHVTYLSARSKVSADYVNPRRAKRRRPGSRPLARALLGTPEMQRILVVLRGPIDVGTVRRRCALTVTGPYEMAVCHVLPAGHDGIRDSLHAQKQITAALRVVLGGRAENVAVLVASDRLGEGVDECAKEWGATLVYP